MEHSATPLLGRSDAFLSVVEQVSRLARLNRPVLILGERGTGKELIAERLHFLSTRWEGSYVTLNCAALSESLLESELFGHESGAFTGARSRHHGCFERADRGTLFLDELATTSGRVQEKLLRVLETGRFDRLGGQKPVQVDVRVIGATNEDLPSLAARGEFRADLLDRLAFEVITLPPLRARQDDILLLAEHFAIGMCKELRRELFPGFSPAACQQLLSYPWPGNVRELKNVIERSVARHEETSQPLDTIFFDPFASPWRISPNPASADKSEPGQTDRANTQTAPDQTGDAAEPAKADATEGLSPQATLPPADFKQALASLEKQWLEQALSLNQFNQKRAAEQLGLSYHQLRGYLRKHKLTGSG